MSRIMATIIKANARYICQNCGNTELLQAHHNIPGDDSSLACLCAECHSKRHPDVPRALFFTENKQPYWYNRSASSIGKEFKVHPRTVIRWAKRLQIGIGRITAEQIYQIRSKLNKFKVKKTKVETIKVPKIKVDKLRETYRIRKPFPDKKFTEVTFPYKVIEKESRYRGLSFDEFINRFNVVAEYSVSGGVRYTFEELYRESNQPI